MKHVFLLFTLFLTLSGKADISNVPSGDIKNIKSLLECLIFEENFAYPIFGSKPMALAGFCLDKFPSCPTYKRLEIQLLFIKKRGWLDSWHKYKEELVFKDFIFIEDEDFFGFLSIFLINKKSLLSILKDHELIFIQQLGDSFTPESFLEKITKRDQSLGQAIRYNLGLLGIMLGYGVRNSMLFQETTRLYWEKKRLKGVLRKDSALHKHYEEVSSQLECFNEFEEFSAIMPLHFASDNTNPETVALRKKYKEDQLKIVELMSQPNFMDRVLERLLQ